MRRRGCPDDRRTCAEPIGVREKPGRGKREQVGEVGLARARTEEIIPAHDLIDARLNIVDHRHEVVGEHSIAAHEHEVVDVARGVPGV